MHASRGMRFRWAWIFVAALLVASPRVRAEGALEINGACVATGCFPGDSEGFPVTLANPGSYVLTGNLTSSAVRTLILITSADVSLDLQGHALLGPGVCTGEPVTSCSPGLGPLGIEVIANNASISNGTIRGMVEHAITDGSAAIRGTRISNVRAVSNGAVAFDLNDHCSVEDSHIERNGGSGVRGQHGCRIHRNSVILNGGVGIFLNGQGRVSDNLVRQNATSGIATGSGSLILDNEIALNGDYGLNLVQSGYRGNTLLGNTPDEVICANCSQLGSNLCGGSLSCPGPIASLTPYTVQAPSGGGAQSVATAAHGLCVFSRVAMQTADEGTFKYCELTGTSGSTWTLTARPGGNAQSGVECTALCF